MKLYILVGLFKWSIEDKQFYMRQEAVAGYTSPISRSM